MKNDLHILFQLAAKYFIKKYKKEGGAQSILANELGITQSYLSSVVNGSRSASLELYSQIAEKLYGPLDKFLAVGRRINEGEDPLAEKEKLPEDPVENLIAKLTYYVVDHQRIEKELSELKQFYETIVENQHTGILVTDKDHNTVYVNKFMSVMSASEADSIIGTTPFNADKKIPGFDISEFTEKYQDAFEQRQPHSFSDIKIKMPNGKIVYNSGTLIPLIKEGTFDGMICTIDDTTTSHILRNLLTLSLDMNSDGIGIVEQTKPTPQPKVYYMNRKFREIFGLQDVDASKVSFAETNDRIAARLKNGKKWLDYVKKDLSSTNSHDAKITITAKNNKKYEWRTRPLINNDGLLCGRIVVVTDV